MNDPGMLYPHSFRATIKSSSLPMFFALPAIVTILGSGRTTWTVSSGNLFAKSLRVSFRQVLISAISLCILSVGIMCIVCLRFFQSLLVEVWIYVWYARVMVNGIPCNVGGESTALVSIS